MPPHIGLDLAIDAIPIGIGSKSSFAKYLGQVATRCYINAAYATTATGWNCRTAHYARDNITALKVGYGNWYVIESTGEEHQGGNSNMTGSIEYPAGTFTQIKWAGATAVAVPPATTVYSDFVNVDIPKGALFWTRRYQANVNGIAFCVGGQPTMNLALGDAVNNTNVDSTMSGTIADNGNGALVPPQAIVAMTSLPSICALGSSRMVGLQDTTVDSTGDSGYARMFGPNFAYINAGVGGDTIASLTSSHTLRMALALATCSHLWLDPGLNDFAAFGTPAATVIANLQTLAALWPSVSKVIFNDEGPWTTSTDGWATTVNQTVKSFEASRLSLNSSIAAFSGYNQIVKANTFDSIAPTSGFWNNIVSDGFQFTPDGIHENSATLIRMAASGIFSPASVHLP